MGEGGREQALLHEARVVFVWLWVWVLFGGRLRPDLSSVTELGCEWRVGRSTVVWRVGLCWCAWRSGLAALAAAKLSVIHKGWSWLVGASGCRCWLVVRRLCCFRVRVFWGCG